jgi:precorrin-3B C17-methyltransferase
MELYVIGIGPGSKGEMTEKAWSVLSDCQVIAGYDLYVDLICGWFPGKEYIRSSMKKEIQRCEDAIQQAREGKKVAMISSGDAGIYGMAGILHELAAPYCELEIIVIPGITAACSGAALLGAPLTNDFAVISLSDLLTPWEVIEKRINGAAMADFVICFYNPSSLKRRGYLKKACEIILKHQPETLMTGVVRNIGREGESMEIMPLSQLMKIQVDMFTTVFIGNSMTKVVNGKLVTPRGYLK